MTRQAYIESLFEAYTNCTKVTNDLYAGVTLEEAYEVAAGVTSLRNNNNEDCKGYKLSATNIGSQNAFNVKEPIWGKVTRAALANELILSANEKPLVELEIVFIAQEDVDSNLNDKNLLEAFKVAVGLEFPMPRYEGFPKITGGQFVADNVAAWNVAHGEAKQLASKGLDKIKGTLYFNDEKAGENTSECVLLHPVNAIRWLVNDLAKKGQSIKKGEFIYSGSFTPPTLAQKGVYKGEVEGIGSIEFIVK